MTSKNRSLKIAAAVASSFTLLAVLIIVLSMRRVVTFQLGLLMLVALVGLYFGFGVLVVLYRFVGRLR